MSTAFDKGYRILTWVHARYMSDVDRETFASIVNSYFFDLNIKAYMGVCFGKFSRLIDFYTNSAKVATYHLGKIQDVLPKNNIACSFSIQLCKPFKECCGCGDNEQPIRTYTFFKPQSSNVPYSEFLMHCKQAIVTSGLPIEAYWNNSMYPLVVITYGSDYHSIANSILELRKSFNWAVDSSSYFTLKMDEKTYQPLKDQEKGKIPVLISGKLVYSSDISGINLRIGGQDFPGTPYLRFGWHDFCDILRFSSLFELTKYTRQLKQRYSKKISFTSTILLTEVS